MAGYASVFGVALVARLVLTFVPVAYVSTGQRAAWSWRSFLVFALCFAAAVALAARAGLPTPGQSLSRWRRAIGLPATVGAAVALLTIWSDIVSPVAPTRGVATVHVHGWPALPFYIYGAILLTVVFHFFPMALAAWLAQRFRGGLRSAILVLGVAAVALSEDAGYFLHSGPSTGIETARHVLSVLANAAEAVFVYRFGLLGGLAQRSATYLLWHLAWPALGP